MPNQETSVSSDYCSRCGKRAALCVCSEIVSCPTKTKVVILQHPQEPREDLSTAKIVAAALPNALLRVGLSWPNLNAAAQGQEQNRRWGVLYLGTIKNSAAHLQTKQEVSILAPKGSSSFEGSLDGIVALDGNWRQAKALWWRNAWLLKMNRILLAPQEPSLYGKLRREPRPEGLSTLEAIAITLAALEKREDVKAALM
jgi:DTW domain-containing protein YfiP